MLSHSIDKLFRTDDLSDLIDLPKIITVNEFNEKAAKEFRKEFNEIIASGQPIIPIEIDSFGGQAYSLLSMMETINTSPVPVATIVTGKAMSCGAILLTCGTSGYRFAGPYSTVMLHEVSLFSGGKIEEIKADAVEGERLNQLVFRQMAKNCNRNETYFLDIIHEKKHADWYLTPEQCVEHGLVNKVGSFGLKFTLSAKMEVV